jgi:hypothetical protein
MKQGYFVEASSPCNSKVLQGYFFAINFGSNFHYAILEDHVFSAVRNSLLSIFTFMFRYQARPSVHKTVCINA